MPRRIYYSSKDVYDRFMKEDVGIFLTFKDVLLFAACVGYKERHGSASFTPGKKEDKGEIHWEVLERDSMNISTVNALALAETKNLDVVLTTEESYDNKISTLERLADIGIRIMTQKILDQPGDALDNMLGYIFQQLQEKEDSILKRIDNEF